MESKRCRWMPVVPSAWFLLLCELLRCALATDASALRGVAHSQLHLYQNRATFTCISDSIQVEIERVNDDVCDCADGSDEPGTSACSNGKFYCRNQGFKPRHLPSTFVDDGVCDCCDGSDEKHGCHDSCQAFGQLARSGAQMKLDLSLAGAKARSALAIEAQRKVQAWKERSVQLEKIVVQLKPAVAQLYEEMQEAQKQQREAEEAEKASTASPAAHADESAAEENDYTGADTIDNGGHEDEVVNENSDDESVDADEEAKRIAAQWTSNPAAASTGAHPEDVSGPDGAESDEVVAEQTTYEPKSALQTLADMAVKKHSEKKHELRTAETELRTLQANLERDYGPGTVYAALHDVCLEMPQDKYRYRVCGFDKAVQVEGASEVSLGKFSRCENGCSTMLYTKGQACWQGPARSMQVKFKCGPHNEIVSVKEPERCVYMAEATSPAQCNDSDIQDLRDELRQLDTTSPEPDFKDEL
eukprot:jgi/Ulvmu1/1711/UM116_0024.1